MVLLLGRYDRASKKHELSLRKCVSGGTSCSSCSVLPAVLKDYERLPFLPSDAAMQPHDAPQVPLRALQTRAAEVANPGLAQTQAIFAQGTPVHV